MSIKDIAKKKMNKKVKKWLIAGVATVLTSAIGLFLVLTSVLILIIAGNDNKKKDECNDYAVENSVVNVQTSEDTEKNAETIYKFLISEFKATPEGASGAVGCMQFESQLNTKAENPSSGAYGIAQWLGPRLTRLNEVAKQQGKDKSDLGVQLSLLKEELHNPYYKKVLDGLKSKDVEEAQKNWLLWFEGLSQDPSQWHLPQRNAYAKHWYSKFKGSKIDFDITETASDSVNILSGTVSCGDGEDYNATTNEEGWVMPVKNFKGSFNGDQDFGPCGSFRPNGWHDGVDFGSMGFGSDKNLYCAHDGKVKNIEYLPQYELGWYVVIDCGDREIAYQEFSNNKDDVKVKVGDKVKAGQPIARLDSRGGSGGVGTHLHFGITKKGGNGMEGLNHAFNNDGYWEDPMKILK